MRPRTADVTAHQPERSRVLDVVKDSFERGVAYPEAKVNAIRGERCDDGTRARR
ncbi:DUF2087 domain-containing protein [Streptomyces longispororuber]|uniref:DUF2087 domain-containing protein n=1 Tax=Streptomyces longispororuber TaxID=68230 RepID=UPI0033DE0DEC